MASMVKKKNTFKPVALLLEWSLPGPFRGSEREMFSWFVLTHFSLDREVRSQSHRSSSKSQRRNPSAGHTMNSLTVFHKWGILASYFFFDGGVISFAQYFLVFQCKLPQYVLLSPFCAVSRLPHMVPQRPGYKFTSFRVKNCGAQRTSTLQTSDGYVANVQFGVLLTCTGMKCLKHTAILD